RDEGTHQMSPQLIEGGSAAADPAEPEPTPPPRQTQQSEQPRSWWSMFFGGVGRIGNKEVIKLKNIK
ncbi:hypothetical protein EVA_06989, partial [gut metagenome]